MSEPNPYESPKSEEPLQPAQVVKRGIGAGTIGCLTPVAVIITGWISCDASIYFTEKGLDQSDWGDALLVGLLIAFIPPLVVLAAMVWWAQRAYVREQLGKDAKQTED